MPLSQKNENLRHENRRLKKLLKKKDAKNKALKSKLSRVNPFGSNKSMKKRRANFEQTPTDIISTWIQNPGYNLIAETIFSYLDTRALAKCREVSKIWKRFISNNKNLLIIQTTQLWKAKHRFVDLISHERKCMTYFEKAVSQSTCQIEPKSNFEWDHIFSMMKLESVKCVKRIRNKIKENVIRSISNNVASRGNAKDFCLANKFYKLFSKLVNKFSFSEWDIWIFRVRDYYNPKSLKILLQYFKTENINVNQLKIQFDLLGNDNRIEMLEILFENAEDLGINLNEKNYYDKSILDIAIGNEDKQLIELCEKYGLGSRKRKRQSQDEEYFEAN